MTDKPFPNEALTDTCEMLLDEWGLTLEQIRNLSGDLPGECEAIMEARNEAAWEAAQERFSSGVDDETFRRHMINAGRGHLLK
jgi:hypothetical protein